MMFEINIYLRFALIVLGIVGGILLSVFNGFWYGFPFILIGIILLVGYVMMGTVQSAAKMMQAGNMEGTEERLKLTWKPEWLFSVNKAYYYMLKGTIASHNKDMNAAEEWLKKAQTVDIPTANEKAMIELQLANIAATKQKWQQAKLHLKTIKSMSVTEPAVLSQVEQLEKAIKQSGQLKAATRMGAGQIKKGGMPLRPGGKRRRPKMR